MKLTVPSATEGGKAIEDKGKGKADEGQEEAGHQEHTKAAVVDDSPG